MLLMVAWSAAFAVVFWMAGSRLLAAQPIVANLTVPAAASAGPASSSMLPPALAQDAGPPAASMPARAGASHWLRSLVPPVLLQIGPRQLPFWQWAAIALLFALAWFLGYAASKGVRRVLIRLVSRTTLDWDENIVERIGGPLTLGLALIVALVATPMLDLDPAVSQVLVTTLRTGLLAALSWVLVRSVDMVGRLVGLAPWASHHPLSRTLVPLGTRAVKVIVGALAILAILSELGYPVGSLVAGLGIGGLAFALAAQKTIENLFGAFSIAFDEPFREGDVIRLDGVIGTVEAIGLRSTRIRTPDRTVISLPNGKLADMRVETLAARDRMRFSCTLPLHPKTSSAQLAQVTEEIDHAVRSASNVWLDDVSVSLATIDANGIQVEITASFATLDNKQFVSIRHALLLEITRIVERAGVQIGRPLPM